MKYRLECSSVQIFFLPCIMLKRTLFPFLQTFVQNPDTQINRPYYLIFILFLIVFQEPEQYRYSYSGCLPRALLTGFQSLFHQG